MNFLFVHCIKIGVLGPVVNKNTICSIYLPFYCMWQNKNKSEKKYKF